MNTAEPLGVCAEELFHLWPGKKLQAHRVNLARFIRGPEIIEELLPAALVPLKRMPHLVRKDLHVPLGAVEVGEDERHAVRGKARAEAAAGFPFAVFQVQEAGPGHQAEEVVEAAAE